MIIEFQIKVTLHINIFPPYRKLRPNVVLPQSGGNEEAAPFEKNWIDLTEQCFWFDFHTRGGNIFCDNASDFCHPKLQCDAVLWVAHVEKIFG